MSPRSPSSTLLALGIGALMFTPLIADAGTVVLQDLTSGGIASAFPNRTPVTETPDRAFDNLSSTKGLIFNDVANDNASPYEDVTVTNPAIWTYAFSGSLAFTILSYSLTSANDSPERDPRDFFLEGSNNGSLWTIVDTVTGHQFNEQPGFGDNTNTTNRFETYFFAVDTPASYSQYRLRTIETFGTTNDRPQIAEIQLFDTVVVPEPTVSCCLLLSAGALLVRRRRSA